MDGRPYILGLVEMIDWTINFGSMLQIAIIVGGGFLVLVRMNYAGSSLQKEVTELKADVKKFGAIVTDNAVINNRLQNLEQDVHELRHGEGFVQGRRGIDGEWPR